MQTIGWLNVGAFIWFLCVWIGYAQFARLQARRSDKNLSSVMNRLRKRWMEQLVKREVRIPDAALIAGLERNVTFLASSSMLILAGLLTALAATDQIQAVLVEVPFYMESSSFLLHLKIFILILIYNEEGKLLQKKLLSVQKLLIKSHCFLHLETFSKRFVKLKENHICSNYTNAMYYVMY